MRRTFAKELLKHAKRDKNIVLITCDLGYGMWDAFRDELPAQFWNVGAAEQGGMGIAVGLAMEGKTVFIYSITTFLLRRAYETLNLYVHGEGVPVKLVGSGRDKDYVHDGPSHDASDAQQILDTLPNILQFWPEEKEEIPLMVKSMIVNEAPCFISLRR